MVEEFTSQESKAPFNMAIATLMSLRNTLDEMKTIERRYDLPATERQRMKIELTKRFYIDSCPLIMDTTIIEKYKFILDLVPAEAVVVNRKNGKGKKRIVYSQELNKQMDIAILELQVELQKKNFYMSPREDYGSSGMKMR